MGHTGGMNVDEIAQLLDGFHHAAAVADADAYFGSMTSDAVFVGTDASERWTRDEFERYAASAFAKDSAWIYRATQRHVTLGPAGDVAWFDEQLDSASFGQARGSGVVVATDGGPRIAHYVLSFPIPNEAVPAVLEALRP